jgi:hypothetical protein
MTFVIIDNDVSSMYAGLPASALNIYASGSNTDQRKIELTRDHSLKQTYVVTVSHRSSWVELDDIKQWVDDTFGARTPGYHNPRWSSDGYRKWCFRKEADAMMFIMRWS